MALDITAAGNMTEYGQRSLAILVQELASSADIEPTDIVLSVTQTLTQTGTPTVVIAAAIAQPTESQAKAVLEELRPVLATAAQASEWLGIEVLELPLMAVQSMPNVSGSILVTPSMLRDDMQQAIQSADGSGAATPASVATPTSSSGDDDTFGSSWRAVRGVHLLWLLPVMSFVLVMFCCAWLAFTSRSILDAPKEVADVSQRSLNLIDVVDDAAMDSARRRQSLHTL